jgi:glycosyltransferase involved in cell wall biosynthesis
MKSPEISIIIITKNDEGVAITLDALKHVQYPAETEIIVVDGSLPKNRLEHIREKYSEVFWLAYDSSKDKKATFSQQRNMGVRSARGKCIIFLDSSCIPREDWLTILYSSINDQHPIVASKTESLGMTSVYGANSKTTLTEIKESNGNGLGMEKSVFDKIGGFDERFSYGEDTDFSWRASDAGYKIMLNPKAVIGHDFGDFKTELKRAFRYGAARAKLYRRHTERVGQLLGHDINVLAYSLFIVFSPIAIIFPAYLLILLIPIILNIRRRPFAVVGTNFIYGLGAIVGLVTPGYAV